VRVEPRPRLRQHRRTNLSYIPGMDMDLDLVLGLDVLVVDTFVRVS